MSDGLPEHPGTVEWIDGTSGELLRRDAAADVDEGIRYAPDAEGRPQPVVRIVVTTVGDQREIEQVGQDGTVLMRTYQVR